MKALALILSSLFCLINILIAQTYLYDNNHQLIEIKYNNNITVSIQYDANGNRISYSVFGGPLPVTLLSFNAQKSGEQVLLTWSTSTEINTDKFDVEYSKDGNSFSSFITVPAKRNSSTRKDYSTIHCCPIKGMNFYRLKLIDKDGSFKYSEIRKVVFEFENVMKLYPNPVTSKSAINISFKKPFAKDANVRVYNSNGALVYNSILFKNETLLQIKTEVFAAGSYYVIVAAEYEIYKEKFVKQ